MKNLIKFAIFILAIFVLLRLVKRIGKPSDRQSVVDKVRNKPVKCEHCDKLSKADEWLYFTCPECGQEYLPF